MGSPFLAITLDLKRRIGRAARALGMDVGAMAWGVLELLEHVWERKDPAVSELVVAACFGPDTRVAPVLVEFGLLLVVADGWELCKEETDRLLLTHRQRVAAGKARAEGAERSGGAFTSGRTSGPPAADQRTASGGPALTPSTQHPAPKEDPPRAGARAEPGEADRPVPAAPKSSTAPPAPTGPPLVETMDALHRTTRGRPLEWGPPKHRVAVERAIGDLAAEHGDAEVLQRLRNALTYLPGKFPYFAVANDLAQHWGRYAEPAAGARVERPSEQAPPQVDRRTLGAVWGPALERLEAEGKSYAALQLERLREVSSTPDAITLEAPDADAVAWVEHHYGPLLERALAPRKPRLVVAGAGPDPPDSLAEQVHEDERPATAAEGLRVVREAVGGK